MKKANISKIKAELSKYIRFAKQGEEIIITDRDQPVAKIVGIDSARPINIREPSGDLLAILRVADQRNFDQDTDIHQILLQDREERW